MKRHLTFVWLAMGFLLMLVPFTFVLKSSVSASNLRSKAPAVRDQPNDELMLVQTARPALAAPLAALTTSDFPRKLVSAVIQDQSRYDVLPTTKQPKANPPAGVPTPAVPTNDNCANAVAIAAFPFSDSRSNVGATTEAGEPQLCSNISATMWYSYTNTRPNTVSIVASTCTSSPTDTVLSAYQVTGAACAFAGFVNVACDDDGCGIIGGPSTISFDAAPGASYKIQVGGFAGSTGDITLNITGVEQLCPPVVINGTLGSGAPGFTGMQFSGDQTDGNENKNRTASSCS